MKASTKQDEKADNKVDDSNSMKLRECAAIKTQLKRISDECRMKIEAEVERITKEEQEECDRARKEDAERIEQEIQAVKVAYETKVSHLSEEYKAKQEKQFELLKRGEADFEKQIEKKKIDMENDIQHRLEVAQAEIEQYRAKRYKEMQDQLELDVKVFAEKRLEAHSQLVEQLKAKLELETCNELNKAKLDNTILMNDLREKYQQMQAEEAAQLTLTMNEKIQMLKELDEKSLADLMKDIQKLFQVETEKSKQSIEELYSKERIELKTKLEELEHSIQARKKAEELELETRIAKKKVLLQVMNLPGTIRIADEDFLPRYKFKIIRVNIILQTNDSTIYEALKEDPLLQCCCKLTMFNKWSHRHKKDFMRLSPKIYRYIAQRKESLPFPRVFEILHTDQKLYMFMEYLNVTGTVESYVRDIAKRRKNDLCTTPTPAIPTPIIVLIMRQVLDGIRFLDNMLVAHMNLRPEHLGLIHSDDTVHVMITDLSRAVAYYNIERDEYCKEPPIDLTEKFTEHLPAECFQGDFCPKNVDMYSVGFLLSFIALQRSPFDYSTGRKMLAVKSEEPVNVGCEHAYLADLVLKLTDPDPEKRLMLSEVSEHRFFGD